MTQREIRMRKRRRARMISTTICMVIAVSIGTVLGSTLSSASAEEPEPEPEIRIVERPIYTEPEIRTVVKTEQVTRYKVLSAEEDQNLAAKMIAKTLWGEARGLTTTEQAAVVWCILNRVDSADTFFPDTIEDVITQQNQFDGYSESFPVQEDLLNLAKDVMARWQLEKLGVGDVGRVLPIDYLYFTGDGKHNSFTTGWKTEDYWDWSLHSPY